VFHTSRLRLNSSITCEVEESKAEDEWNGNGMDLARICKQKATVHNIKPDEPRIFRLWRVTIEGSVCSLCNRGLNMHGAAILLFRSRQAIWKMSFATIHLQLCLFGPHLNQQYYPRFRRSLYKLCQIYET
jgi:hypothetical protein